MQHGARRSPLGRMMSWLSRLGRPTTRSLAGLASIALVPLLAMVLLGSAGTSTTEGGALPEASAPTATAVPTIESSKLLVLDRRQLEALDRFIERGAKPSPTSTPTPEPTATAVPPTPVPTSPPARAQSAPQQPAPPPPPPPTSTPAPPPPPPPPPPPTATPVPVAPGLDTSPMDSYAYALFEATNRRRVGAGLAPLRANGYLVGIARIRSNEMAQYNYFAHESPITGDTAFSLMDKYGIAYGWAGENLAKNNYPDSEATAVADQSLWDSPPHRENILNPNFTDMGIAHAVDGSGMHYFTVVFTSVP